MRQEVGLILDGVRGESQARQAARPPTAGSTAAATAAAGARSSALLAKHSLVSVDAASRRVGTNPCLCVADSRIYAAVAKGSCSQGLTDDARIVPRCNAIKASWVLCVKVVKEGTYAATTVRSEGVLPHLMQAQSTLHDKHLPDYGTTYYRRCNADHVRQPGRSYKKRLTELDTRVAQHVGVGRAAFSDLVHRVRHHPVPVLCCHGDHLQLHAQGLAHLEGDRSHSTLC